MSDATPLLPFRLPLLRGTLLRRYKRFLADVELEDGRTVTVHVPNSGTMKTCSDPGSEVIVSDSGNPKRKLPLTLEMVRVAPGANGWAGVNTSRPNALVAAAIEAGRVPRLAGYPELRREVNIEKGSRLDIVLEGGSGPRCLVEVKNVTMVQGRAAAFPDAVTARGRKHLEVLERAADDGDRAVIFFLVQRPDCEVFSTADHIDPDYGKTLRRVTADGGVELIAWRSVLSVNGADIERSPITYVPAPELDE